MPDNVDRIVIFPRYTGLIGTGDLIAALVDVRAYSEVIFVGWQSTGLGVTPATVQFVLQVSADLDTWFNSITFPSVPAAATEFVQTQGLVYQWMRVKAVVTGADPGLSVWLVADLVRRRKTGMEEAA